MNVHKQHNFFVSVHTSARLINPAQLAESIFLIVTLLMGPCQATPAGSASLLHKAQFCNARRYILYRGTNTNFFKLFEYCEWVL